MLYLVRRAEVEPCDLSLELLEGGLPAYQNLPL
jgi:hypothetical protein